MSGSLEYKSLSVPVLLFWEVPFCPGEVGLVRLEEQLLLSRTGSLQVPESRRDRLLFFPGQVDGNLIVLCDI